jgi:hypothetical protein
VQRKFPFSLLLVGIASLAHADTLKLKTGEVIEGNVTIEVQFSPTIVETQVIPRENIEALDRQSPDEAAYAKLEGIKVPETILNTSALDTARKPLQEFIRKFSYSHRVVDAKERLAAMDAEMARIEAGEIKLEGRWVSQEEYAAEKYQIEAAILAAELQQQLAARNPGGVLNAFGDLRAKYPNSVAYVNALAAVRQSLTEMEGRLEFELRNLPVKLEARRKTIERTSQADRARVEKALADEDARLKATADAAKSGTRKFFAISSIDEAGLKQMQAAAKEIRASLAKVDDAALQAGIRAVAAAQSNLEAGNIDAAEAAIADLKAKWSQYEGLSRLEAAVTAAQKSATATPTPEASPQQAATPPAAASPSPSPAKKGLDL